MANQKIIEQKEKEVKELADKIKNAGLVLLTDYRGINVEDVTNLRREVRKANGEYCVIKNNITRRALKECGFDLDSVLVGPPAGYGQNVINTLINYYGQDKGYSSRNGWSTLLFRVA